ncbi:radical SAM/SPASM domain-containing protein [Clostridioides sp. ES-S-0001-02]|uniref:radical SAM/SPASM domain-containing protein n=1 Tax=Clostridioides sp. ES-S-0001-02 TaxID=2770770 RepID=UPI001D12FD1B|nr:radical SAM protein [Clostridioides sp. ES-S-0001-02]
MYILTLEINQKCNLKCTYCYLGEKSGTEMKKEDAIEAINLGINQAKKHKDKKLVIDFVGGEASLDFNFIKDLVKYSQLKIKDEDIFLEFMTTTNAICLNKDMIDFYILNKFSLKVSIDGNKYVNDLNRINYNGEGSYDNIVDKLNLLRYYEKNVNKFVQVTNVITKNNYREYYNSLVHLTAELGFKFIDTAIDFCYEWNKEEYKIIEENIYKSFDYFIDCYKNNQGFIWSFINKSYKSLEQLKKTYSCGAGIVSLYVRNNGDYHTCPVSFNECSKLGDINNGLDLEKIKFLKNIDSIENKECKLCDIYEYCSAKGCVMGNYAKNRDLNTPIDMSCWMSKLKYKLIREKKDTINEIFATCI